MCRVFILVPYVNCTRCHEVSSPTSLKIDFTMAMVQHCVNHCPVIRGNWIWKWCDGFCILDPDWFRCVSSRCVFMYWGHRFKISTALNPKKKWQFFHFLISDRGVLITTQWSENGCILCTYILTEQSEWKTCLPYYQVKMAVIGVAMIKM